MVTPVLAGVGAGVVIGGLLVWAITKGCPVVCSIFDQILDRDTIAPF